MGNGRCASGKIEVVERGVSSEVFGAHGFKNELKFELLKSCGLRKRPGNKLYCRAFGCLVIR